VASSTETPRQVYVAASANLVIAVSKFVVALFTGSSAMLSEGVHSLADTGNQLLLLFGIKRSRKSPDETHPFGYGQEIYFWGFMVAIVLFSIGGGVSIYEGIRKLGQHAEMGSPTWNYLVLAIAAIAESLSFRSAFKVFRKSLRPQEHWWDAFRTSKDPSVFIVLAEDVAGLLGIVVAAIGIWLAGMFRSPIPDATAAIVIGVILAAVAVLMGFETKALLLGESADPEIVEEIRRIASQDPLIAKAQSPLTMHFAPNQILVNMVVEFKNGASGDAILASIDRFEKAIRQRFPAVRQIFVEAESLRHPERNQRIA
jgi:cation diffusion facilitator family transporter